MSTEDAQGARPSICERYERISGWFAKARSHGPRPMEAPYLGALGALIPARARVMDLGCGMGEPMAGHFIRLGHEVTGVDGSAAMAAMCRERFPHMTWLHRDMRGLDLGERFHAVLAWDSFFHLNHADQRAMFPVFARHMLPGATLLFTSGPDHGESPGVMDGVAFEHYSLSPGEYRELCARHGLKVLLHRPEDPDCGGHTVWLAQLEG